MNIKHIFIVVMGLSAGAFSAISLGALKGSPCYIFVGNCNSITTKITVQNNTEDGRIRITRVVNKGAGSAVVKSGYFNYISPGQEGAITYTINPPGWKSTGDLISYVSMISVTVRFKNKEGVSVSQTPCTLRHQTDIRYDAGVGIVDQWFPTYNWTRFTPTLTPERYQCAITDNSQANLAKLGKLIQVW